MFRLLTYNIKRGGHGRVDLIANVIKAAAPDLVLLQEATDPLNVGRIAAATGMPEWRAMRRQSLGFLSRQPVASSEWTRPRFSRHAFIEVTTQGAALTLFGLHLSAVHAAWTERRRVFEIRALLRGIARHQRGFHVLAGDFNTLAPDEPLEIERLPFRLRPLVWLSGGRIRWRTIHTILEAGYVDGYRLKHPHEPGPTLPTAQPHIRLDYVFVPAQYEQTIVNCDVFQHPDAVAASDHFPVVADLRMNE